MPKTKLQSVVFTMIMVFLMVYCMTVYTVSINMGGLNYNVFLIALKEMWIEYAVVFVLIFFLITRTSMKLALRIIDPKKNPPIFMVLAIQCFTVCQIVPMITLFATFFHNGFTGAWFTQWITLIVYCFPMALCLQVFFIGPLVRHIFRAIFYKQLEPKEASSDMAEESDTVSE